MSGINSYSKIPIPESALTDQDGKIAHIWYLFLANLASGIAPFVYQKVDSGFNFTVPQGVKNIILDPSGVIATGTLVTPIIASDGQEIVFTTSQTITACTFTANTGQTIVNAPTTLTAGISVSFIFVQSTATWYKK